MSEHPTQLSIIVESDYEDIHVSLTANQIRFITRCLRHDGFTPEDNAGTNYGNLVLWRLEQTLDSIVYRCVGCDQHHRKMHEVEGDFLCSECAVKALHERIDEIECENGHY